MRQLWKKKNNMKSEFNYNFLNKKNILVTGGTGSFGSYFVKTVLNYSNPKRLVIFSRDEFKQSELQKELANHPNNKCLRFFIGDVRNLDRLKVSCRDIEILVHAAALKQIDTAEYNPFELLISRSRTFCSLSRSTTISSFLCLPISNTIFDRFDKSFNISSSIKLIFFLKSFRSSFFIIWQVPLQII